MAHVEALLDEDSDEADKALLEQLIDSTTKEHFRTQGKDPMDYVKKLHAERKNIAKTFARMPMAENSPTVIVRQPGNGIWVIELTGQAARSVKFTELWVRQDSGQWKLQWIK